MDADIGKALVMPPPTGIWTTFSLKSCRKGNPSSCLTVPDCAVVYPGPATCRIPGALPFQSYTVVAVAKKAGSPNTLPSNIANFTTRIP